MLDLVGCSTLAFRTSPLDEALARISRLGFRYVDVAIISGFCPHYPALAATPDDDARLLGSLESLGLKASTLNVGSGVPLNGPAGPETEVAFVRRCLELGRRLGAYAVTVQPGRRLEPALRASYLPVVAREVRRLADLAEQAGIDLTLEAPHRGTLAETLPEVVEVLEAVDDRRVGVTLDTSHVLNGGGTIDRALELVGDRVRHVHLRDYRDGSIQVTPGKGVIDFGAFLAWLREHRYARQANLELEYHDTSPEHAEAEIRAALEYLRPLASR